jgi:hypothetical protein
MIPLLVGKMVSGTQQQTGIFDENARIQPLGLLYHNSSASKMFNRTDAV